MIAHLVFLVMLSVASCFPVFLMLRDDGRQASRPVVAPAVHYHPTDLDFDWVGLV